MVSPFLLFLIGINYILHSFDHSFNHLLIQSFIQSFIQPFNSPHNIRNFFQLYTSFIRVRSNQRCASTAKKQLSLNFLDLY